MLHIHKSQHQTNLVCGPQSLRKIGMMSNIVGSITANIVSTYMLCFSATGRVVKPLGDKVGGRRDRESGAKGSHSATPNPTSGILWIEDTRDNQYP